jgi:paraquat-inducible protein B
MSQKANPTTIGLFIVVGLGLLLGGLLLFSSGKWFRTTEKFIVYFDTSLQGLEAGAPVKYRGVTIGRVVEVLIAHNQASDDFAMPVIIEIDRGASQAKSDKQLLLGKDYALHLIEEGLRAKLEAESLVTGVLYVELAIDPEAGPPELHQVKPEYVEIPAEPTDIQQLLANLGRLDLAGISEKLNHLLDRVDKSLGEVKVHEINTGVSNILASANRLLNSHDLTNSLAEVKLAVGDLRALIKRLDNQVDPIAGSMTNTLAQAQQTLAELRRGMQSLSSLAEPGAPLRSDLREALDKLGNAANAIADLAEFLQRNPNALITGRKPILTPP